MMVQLEINGQNLMLPDNNSLMLLGVFICTQSRNNFFFFARFIFYCFSLDEKHTPRRFFFYIIN